MSETMSGTTATKKPEIKVGDLQFREIFSDNAEARKLLLAREAVHPLADNAELDKRLARGEFISTPLKRFSFGVEHYDNLSTYYDKRCFGLFAPSSDVPEVAVFVKLMHLPTNRHGQVKNKNLPGDIREILDAPVQKVTNPNTAVFYTITNMGVSKLIPGEDGRTAGERLIGEVAKELAKQGIKNFTTLSPVRSGTGKAEKSHRAWLGESPNKTPPKGFKQWLEEALQSDHPPITPSETAWLKQKAKEFGLGDYATTFDCILIPISFQ